MLHGTVHLNESPKRTEGGQDCTLHIQCQRSKINFLVDSGASHSVVPLSFSRKQGFQPSDKVPRLLAANKSPIQTTGTWSALLHFPGVRPLQWSFVVADVSTPILGADLLKYGRLSIHFAGPALSQAPPNHRSTASADNIYSVSQDNPKLSSLLNRFKGLFVESLEGQPAIADMMDDLNVSHHIVTVGPPLTCMPRRLEPSKEASVAEEIRDMLRQKVIRPSSSPWASPAHTVLKSDGKWRLCGDYRRLNVVTQKDNYPIPNIYAFASRLAGARIFSHIDLLKGYWQLPMAKEDVPKTVLATTRGLYEFVRMPFGLRNASNTFQRLMDQLTRDLPGVFAYLDDLLVFADDPDQHLKRLEKLLQRLERYGLRAAPSKCSFGKRELNFLGFHISAKGVKPPMEKVDAITKMPTPKTGLDLRRFLGALNFYKRFLPELSGNIRDLYAASNKRGPLMWNNLLEAQFQVAKEALKNAATLAYPKQGAPLCISSDASGFGMAGVLEQYEEGHWRPLAFFSKKMTPAEMQESTYNRELIGAYNAVRHFQHLIEGRGCVLVVDHAPLIGSFNGARDALTDRQRRQLSYLSELVKQIYPISGKNNVVADMLSRLPINAIQEFCAIGLDLDSLQLAQERDPELRFLVPPKFDFVRINNSTLLCDVSNSPRIYIPLESRRAVLDYFHNQAHQGVKQTRRAIAERCFWPDMTKMVQDFVRGCRRCQLAKTHKHNRPPPNAFVLPNARFEHVHLDFVGSLPISHNGNAYLLTCIDRYTRMAVAVPTNGMTAETLIENFMFHWIAMFGLPRVVTTDNGPCFTAGQWRGFLEQYNIKHVLTTTYHPESNGIIERFHRTLKASLIAKGGDWEKELPIVMLHLRSAVKEDLRYAPAELTFGALPLLPGSLIPRQELIVEPNVFGQEFCQIKFPDPEAPRWHTADRNRNAELDFTNSDQVFIRRDGVQPSLSTKYSGPYRIVEKYERAYKILVDGKEQVISIDRLKPYIPYRDPYLQSLPAYV